MVRHMIETAPKDGDVKSWRILDRLVFFRDSLGFVLIEERPWFCEQFFQEVFAIVEEVSDDLERSSLFSRSIAEERCRRRGFGASGYPSRTGECVEMNCASLYCLRGVVHEHEKVS